MKRAMEGGNNACLLYSFPLYVQLSPSLWIIPFSFPVGQNELRERVKEGQEKYVQRTKEKIHSQGGLSPPSSLSITSPSFPPSSSSGGAKMISSRPKPPGPRGFALSSWKSSLTEDACGCFHPQTLFHTALFWGAQVLYLKNRR